MRNVGVKLAGIMFAAAGMTGCLRSDVAETWYVDAGGAVTWAIHEQHVRSDSQSTLDRRTEESEYWLAVQQDRHPMVEGLRELRGERVRTVVLRDESPFTVLTEARFPGLDILGQRLIAAIGCTGTSIVKNSQGTWEWTLVVRDPSAFGASVEPSSGVEAVMDGMDRLKVVLTSGRFHDAEGFTISADGRVATFSYREPEQRPSDQPSVTLRLTWKIGD